MPDPSGTVNLHVPVLASAVVEGLVLGSAGLYVDGTIGTGGHAQAILSLAPPGSLLMGIDRDAEALKIAAGQLKKFQSQLLLRHGSYLETGDFLHQTGRQQCQGFLLDLGLSTYSLQGSRRGFSYRADEPLDMRFDDSTGSPLSAILPTMDEHEISQVIWNYGEERRATHIARAIRKRIANDSMQKTADLVEAVSTVTPFAQRNKSMARVFQAFRIVINSELDILGQTLARLADWVETGCRIVIIAYHSLEDRIVKQYFKQESRDCICPPALPECRCDHRASFKIITRKPVVPSQEEIYDNPRARSAKLRIMERI